MAWKVPEILYVNSKITEPAKLSKELFTSWYNDVHIPDIFATSGIKQAFRYITTASDPESVERPYLALYPINFGGYLQSMEFKMIPVASDVLPGPSHEIFDVADFDTRYYKTVADDNAFRAEPYLLTVQHDSKSGAELPSDAKSSGTYHCYFSRQNRKAPEENELGTPLTHLCLMWYATEEELNAAAETLQTKGKAARFKLLQAFAADT